MNLRFPGLKYAAIWVTLGLNLFLLSEYLLDHNNSRNVVLIFWIQSILLGMENVLMMIFTRTGMPIIMNNQPSTTSIFTNIFMAGFFMVHYGVFILGFGAIAVFSEKLPGQLFHADWVIPTLLLMCILAVIEVPFKIMEVRRRNYPLVGLMFIPYLRLLPFAIIIFGGEKILSSWLFPLFLLGKIVVDLVYTKYFNFNQPPVMAD